METLLQGLFPGIWSGPLSQTKCGISLYVAGMDGGEGGRQLCHPEWPWHVAGRKMEIDPGREVRRPDQ